LSHFYLEDRIHHHLEGGGRVGEAEEHDQWFEESFTGEECCFPLVSFLDAYVVVSPPYIEFGEEGTSAEVVYYLWNQRGDVSVFLCPFVERSIVLDRSELFVLFSDVEEVGTTRGFRYSNRSSLEVFFDDLSRFFVFFLRERKKSSRECSWCSR
jgi:hypothetical protein